MNSLIIEAELKFEEKKWNPITGCTIPATWWADVVSDVSDFGVDRIYTTGDCRSEVIENLVAELKRICGGGKLRIV